MHRLAAVAAQLADLRHAAGDEAGAEDLMARSAAWFAEVALPAERPQVWLLSQW